jgi:hypothetical protein
MLAGLGEGPDDTENPPEVKVIDSTAVDGKGRIDATFPLGAKFSAQLVEVDPSEPNKYEPLQANSHFKLNAGQVKPAVAARDALFSNNVLIEYAADKAGNFKYFQAVHLGTVTLTIKPKDDSTLPVKVFITVNKPASLGTTYTGLDPRIVDLAHQRGIPPQFIKGQVLRESYPPFDPESFRYEPISWDFSIISTGRDLRTNPPYKRYRLATTSSGDDGPLAQGPLIRAEDVEPRAKYMMCPHGPIPQPGFAGPFPPWVCADGLTALAPATDAPPQYISALNLLAANPHQNWLLGSTSANVQQVFPNREVLDFTAQTHLAASFGLLQIGYMTALSPMQWTGVGGRQNPSYLFDTNENLAAGGGSLAAGTGYLRRVCFPKASPNLDVDSPEFEKYKDFRMAFQKAFNVYNHKTTDEYRRYGSTVVVANAGLFRPVADGPIF